MALARHNQAILDTAGNVVHGASVEVRNETTGLLPQLYSDRAGTVAIGNPFTAADGADAGFHVVGGAYKITATSGAFSRIWRYVAIGTNAEADASQYDGFRTTGFTINTSGSDQMQISGGTQNVLILNGVGNSKTSAIHLNPGSGTLATDTVAEYVLQRTADQSFGGNYGRVSFSALGSGSGNIDMLHAEYGGSVTPVRFDFGIGLENPVSTFASYNFMSLGYASGGSEASQLGAVWFGNDLQTAQRNQISLIRAAIGSAGARDSHAVLWEGKANDGTERAVWWRQYVDVTSNAGASSFTWQSNLNGAGWNNRMVLSDVGALSIASLALTTALPASSGGTGVANNAASTLTISGNFGTTLTVSGVTALTLPTSGTLATTSNKLSAFAATTSAELLSVISDETGSGALVFASSPTLAGTVALPDGATWAATGLSNNGITYTTVSTICINLTPTWSFSSTSNGMVAVALSPTMVPTGASAGAIQAVNLAGNVGTSAVNIATMRALNASMTVSAGYSGTITNGVGIVAAITNSSANPITAAIITLTSGTANGNGITSGTVTNTGFQANAHTAAAASGGTITNKAALFNVPTGSGAGTTTNYGLSIEGNGGSGGGGTTTNYALNVSSTAPSAFAADVTIFNGTAIPAGGTASSGYKFSSTANFGVFFGSGAPSLAAAKGSLYLRSDGSTTNDRAYINTNGTTTWSALTTAA